jgi:hypothetical protein
MKEWRSYMEAYKKAFHHYNRIGRQLLRSDGFDSWAKHARFQNVRAIRDALLYDTKEGLAKNLSNKVLEVNFNLRPFYDDCANLLNLHKNIKEAFRVLKLQEGQLMRVKAKTDVTSPSVEILTCRDSTAGSFARWNLTSFSSSVALQMWFQYHLPAISEDEALWKLTMDYLGLSKNQLATTAKIAWNAMPFTFVVDWFVKVGDFIESFEEPNYPVIITPVRALLSTKTKFSASFSYRKWSAFNSGEPFKTYKLINGTLYHRRGPVSCTIDDLERILPPKLGKFSLMKALNATALAGTFIPRRIS